MLEEEGKRKEEKDPNTKIKEDKGEGVGQQQQSNFITLLIYSSGKVERVDGKGGIREKRRGGSSKQ